MDNKKDNDLKRFTPLAKIPIYGRVFFWVFFTIISIEVTVLAGSYLINRKGITFEDEVMLLIVFGAILSVVVSLSVIWAIQLILAIAKKHSTIETQEEFNLLSDLSVAVEKHQLKIYFQPQTSLQTNQIIGMETLLRWQHPKKGLIMPSVFIPLAEKSGLIEMISEWTTMQACIHNKKLLDEGYNLRVAVNISQLLFKDPLLIEHISRILNVTKLPAQNLELEITETAMMEDVEFAINTMIQLRALGLLLSIDDFGTGYSSLAELDRLPVHKLKIDKAFVQAINPLDAGSNIANSIIEMGHKLNLQISVEGIENEQQKNYFAELHCHEGQGYYISPPIPAEQFQQYLTDFSRNFRA